jgi:hypothetical protein
MTYLYFFLGGALGTLINVAVIEVCGRMRRRRIMRDARRRFKAIMESDWEPQVLP